MDTQPWYSCSNTYTLNISLHCLVPLLSLVFFVTSYWFDHVIVNA